MNQVVSPLIDMLTSIAGLVCSAFLVSAGLRYITSSGQPEKLAHAKKVIKNALIGLSLVLAAASLSALLSHAYSHIPPPPSDLPKLTSVKPVSGGFSLVDLIIKAITGILMDIVRSIGQPFLSALNYFTSFTPLMATNKSVFSLWLAVSAMSDSLLVLFICLIGFKVMSATSFNFDEIELKHLLPQLALVFLVSNSSIFVIDIIISLTNGMISALHSAFGNLTVWQSLNDIVNRSASLGLAALIILIVFLVLAFILLVYYVGRLVTLYLGAVLSPLIVLMWLLPSFKDFAISAARTYLMTIFVLFVHVIILLLAASIFEGLASASPSGLVDPLMGLIVGLSTLVALIKTQGVMSQLSYASVGPKSIRRLSSQFSRSLASSQISLKALKG